jgi:oligopeptide transport system substrate-binding protein
MTRRRTLIVTSALAAAACSPGPWRPPWSAGTSDAPRGPLAEQQVLRLGLGAGPELIDPQKVAYAAEAAVVMRVFSNLLAFDAGGNLIPEMAEGLPVVSNDGKALTCTLRSGLTYSDGHPLTARDFEYGWKRLLDPRTGAEYAFAGFAIEGAEEFATSRERDADRLRELRDAVGVRAKDDRTLEFTLRHSAPWFSSVLATWCGLPTREDLVQRAGDRWTEPSTYIGNGPFILRQWEPQSHLTFEVNSRYHLAPPVLKRIEIHLIADPTVALAAYRNDELDVISVQREDLPVILGDPTLKQEYQRYAGGCTTYLGFNTRASPFDLPSVRRAFSAAFDRESLVANVLGGIGVPATQFVPHKLPGHYADLPGQKFDAAEARRLLAEAGYASGRSVPPLKFTYIASARNRARVDAIIEQLRRNLGVEILADPVESQVFTSMIRSADPALQLFLLGWCQDYPDPQNWYSSVFHSQSTMNSTGWANPQFDLLAERADVESDRARRATLYRQAAQLLGDDAPVAFLYHSVVSRLVKPHVAGLSQSPLDYYEGQSTLADLRIMKR